MIEFLNVTKHLGGKEVLHKVNFKVFNHDLVLFHGHNGSGKTTTIRLILNFLKLSRKDEGKIVNDFEKISYIPERLCLPPFISGKEFIRDILRIRGCKVDYQAYFEYLELNPDQLIGGYSKGMRQKLGIIQALITDSELLLMDEPLSGLDQQTQQKAIELLKKIKQDKTIIISTHLINAFDDIPHKMIEFEEGTIHEQNSAD